MQKLKVNRLFLGLMGVAIGFAYFLVARVEVISPKFDGLIFVASPTNGKITSIAERVSVGKYRFPWMLAGVYRFKWCVDVDMEFCVFYTNIFIFGSYATKL